MECEMYNLSKKGFQMTFYLFHPLQVDVEFLFIKTVLIESF